MKHWSRREFMTLAGGLALATALPGPSSAVAGVQEVLGRFFSPPKRVTPAITPNEEFYVTSYRTPPSVRVNQWSLTVKGLVRKPLNLAYPDLLARPTVKRIVTLECIGNTVGGEFISTAEWEGIPLQALLEEAGLAEGAFDVVFRAADGYSDSIRLEQALAGDVLVAHQMNGVSLPEGHGFPARIIVPGVYGMKSVQWLTEIELVAEDYHGYYQKKGWSDEAVIKTMSRIDLPVLGDTIRTGDYVIQGLAFAGTRGIHKVEVSTDGGDRWQPAQLAPPLSPFAWRFWSYQWEIPAPGSYTLLVRATDGEGKVQTADERPPAPDGASGLFEISVRVKA